jgi:hypothetical protein
MSCSLSISIGTHRQRSRALSYRRELVVRMRCELKSLSFR